MFPPETEVGLPRSRQLQNDFAAEGLLTYALHRQADFHLQEACFEAPAGLQMQGRKAEPRLQTF